MKKIIIANWKTFLQKEQTIHLTKEIVATIKTKNDLELVLSPSFLYLDEIFELTKGQGIKLCAQDISTEKDGPATGQISGQMLKEIGCNYVLVGHSERRGLLNEDEKIINKKIKLAYSSGLIPVLCIGESLAERKSAQVETVLIKQLQSAIQEIVGLPEKELIIAYEPIWAIGSGNYLPVAEIEPILKLIKRVVANIYSEKFFDEKVRVLYGGSVNGAVAENYFAEKKLQGLLVGRSSCQIEEIAKIVSAHK